MFVYLNLGIKTYFLYELKNKNTKDYPSQLLFQLNEEGNLEELISRIPNL